VWVWALSGSIFFRTGLPLPLLAMAAFTAPLFPVCILFTLRLPQTGSVLAPLKLLGQNGHEQDCMLARLARHTAFNTSMISSMVAPTFKAFQRCRRVPGAYMCV
jgi:hypothetical protein